MSPNSDEKCAKCNNEELPNSKLRSKPQWITCSNCDAKHHTYCARINAIEFKELSNPAKLWFCINCRGTPTEIGTRLDTMQLQLDRVVQNPTSVNLENIIGSAIDQIVPKVVEKLEERITSTFTTKFTQLENQFSLLKEGIESQINERVAAAVEQNIETLGLTDTTRQKVLESEIDRCVGLRLAQHVDKKWGALKDDILLKIDALIKTNDHSATRSNSNSIESAALLLTYLLTFHTKTLTVE